MITFTARIVLALITVVSMATVPASAQAMTEKFAVHFLETIANGAFQRTGYNVVADASHVTTTYTQGALSNHLDAQFTFVVARQSTVAPVESVRFTFTGQGSYDFAQTGQVQQIDVICSMANISGSRTLVFTYSSTNHLDTRILDESVDVTNTGGGVNRYTVAKHATLVVNGPVELHTVDATITTDGVVATAHLANTSTDNGGQVTTFNTLATSSNSTGQSTQVDADYTLTIDALDQATVQFTTFNISKPDGTYSLNPLLPSTFTTTRFDADTYGVSYDIRLQRPSPVRSIGVSLGGSCGLTRLPGGSLFVGEGWSWNAFAKYTVVGAVSGAGGGAVAGMISTDSAAPIGAGAGALIGGVGGAVTGALAYSGEKAWNWLFGPDDLLPPPEQHEMLIFDFLRGPRGLCIS
jgi:hypothetical protein